VGGDEDDPAGRFKDDAGVPVAGADSGEAQLVSAGTAAFTGVC